MVNTHFIKRTLHYAMIRNNKTFLKIGNVRAPINEITKNPELVPIGHGNTNLPISIIKSLKWMLKKNLLNQDMFLMGLPGFLRLQITFQFLELCNYEFEYLPITHDTTEADIKQRREIKNNNVFYSDLCAVKAALNGRVLIIDGVEKAERNVLPIINNLLENREMQLDDGRFLMAADKYDKLLKTYSIEQLKQWRLERVSTKFQVIALGLPYPTFQSNPLDPPLRSRFQCFNFTTLPFETMLYYSKILAPNVDEKKMENLLSVVYGLMSQNQKLAHFFSKNNVILNTNKLQSTELNNLPLFPVENILKAVQIWNKNPSYSVYYVFSLCYPYKTILKTELQQPILMEFMRKFNVELNELSNFYISKLNIKKNNEQTIAEVNLSHNNTIVVNAGTCIKNTQKFVKIDEFEMLLANMMVTHSESDFCILGARGSGKTTIVKEFANRLGYEIETIMLYQDMNSREMLQQRRILPNGDTIWEDSQLVKAAKNGLLCVLDGLERVHSSLLELIQTLIYQRFLQLPDGSRLLGASQFDLLQQKTKLSAKLLNKKKIFKIAPNFRIIGLGNIESANSSNKWLNEQILSIFLFHTLNPLSFQNEMKIITELIPNVCQQSAEKLLSLAHNLCKSHDQALRGIGNSLSLRKILALLRKNSYDSSEGLYETIQRSVLSRFLPVLVRETFEAKIQEVGIVSLTLKNQENKQSDKLINFKKENLNTNKFYNQVMIPDIVFYDNEQVVNLLKIKKFFFFFFSIFQ